MRRGLRSALDVGSQWAQNVVQTQFGWDAPTLGAYAPTTIAEIGFVGGTSITTSIDQLALSASSPYKGKGTDGKDLGADIAAVKAATTGVVQP